MLVVFLPFLLDVADYGRSVFQESREEIGKESLQSVDVMQVLEEIQKLHTLPPRRVRTK